MDWLNQLAMNPIFITGGVVITALGTLFGVWGVIIALKSRPYKRLAYSMTKLDLVKNNVSKIPNVQITYGGNQVTALSVSRTVFWNAGTDVIDAEDIATGDPLRIEAPDGVQILGFRPLGATSEANQVQFTFSAKSVKIEFDYLEKEDGAGVEVTHTGQKLSFQGHVKGGVRVFARGLYDVSGDYYPSRIFVLTIVITVFITSISGIVLSFIEPPGNYKLVILMFIPLACVASSLVIDKILKAKPSPLKTLISKLSEDE